MRKEIFFPLCCESLERREPGQHLQMICSAALIRSKLNKIPTDWRTEILAWDEHTQQQLSALQTKQHWFGSSGTEIEADQWISLRSLGCFIYACKYHRNIINVQAHSDAVYYQWFLQDKDSLQLALSTTFYVTCLLYCPQLVKTGGPSD